MRDVLEVLRAALCPLACGIYEGEVGPTGKVGAISTSGTLGLSVILQHRVNESCEDVKRPDSGRVFERKIFEILAFSHVDTSSQLSFTRCCRITDEPNAPDVDIATTFPVAPASPSYIPRARGHKAARETSKTFLTFRAFHFHLR